MPAAILVHGGAGPWDADPASLRTAVAACEEAAAAGMDVLRRGGSALDAVEEAVRALEDCPVLEAGRGSHTNSSGKVEMDALIMDGRTLDLGAVAAVRGICNPVSLARRVMTDTKHAFLVGLGAEKFADDIGFPRCSGHLSLKETETTQDTVGAVALDKDGNLAAATSTGGVRGKMPGRVGDSPIAGSGAYADNASAAVAATGDGEALMRIVISKQVCDLVSRGMSVQAACEAALEVLRRRVNGKGGLIAIDRRGQVGIAFNTFAMPHAYADEYGRRVSDYRPGMPPP